jgi:hypothetical protein
MVIPILLLAILFSVIVSLFNFLSNFSLRALRSILQPQRAQRFYAKVAEEISPLKTLLSVFKQNNNASKW